MSKLTFIFRLSLIPEWLVNLGFKVKPMSQLVKMLMVACSGMAFIYWINYCSNLPLHI